LFIDAGTLWVIDFKTAKPAENEPLNKFIQRQQNQHAKQLRFYKTTLCEIYKIPVRFGGFKVNYPKCACINKQSVDGDGACVYDKLGFSLSTVSNENTNQ
jgi:hypothetical protein